MNSKVYKWCVVPQCVNTSIKTPSKLFVYVPNKKTMRYKWLNLARRDPTAISLNSPIYFCEDHFDLPNDMDNYMEYHVMGSVSRVLMTPGCIPTKFGCQSDRREQTCNSTDRSYIQKKQRKILIENCENDLQERSTTTKHLELGETSTPRSELGKSRTEYCRKYRQRKREEKLKAEGVKPIKVFRNSTQRSRDFRARRANLHHSKVKIELDPQEAPFDSLCEVYIKQEPLDGTVLNTVKNEDEDCTVENEVDPLELDGESGM